MITEIEKRKRDPNWDFTFFCTTAVWDFLLLRSSIYQIFYLTYQDVTSRVQDIGSTFLVSAVTGGSISFVKFSDLALLTLKAPITTAADDIHKYFFIVFQRK